MTDQAEKRAWDRRPEEDTKWYERFTYYRDLGVTRSIAAAYRAWLQATKPDGIRPDQYIGSAPDQWYDTHRSWDWEQRATLYDDHIREMWSNDEVLERARRKRVELLTEIAEKTARELVKRDMTETPVNQVSSTMKTATRELREELGTGKPAVQFSVILDKLPPDVQKSLAEALDLDD